MSRWIQRPRQSQHTVCAIRTECMEKDRLNPGCHCKLNAKKSCHNRKSQSVRIWDLQQHEFHFTFQASPASRSHNEED